MNEMGWLDEPMGGHEEVTTVPLGERVFEDIGRRRVAVGIRASACPLCESDGDDWQLAEDHPHRSSAFICAVCEDVWAVVTIPEEVSASCCYGVCLLCGHSVYLGIKERQWCFGPPVEEYLGPDIFADLCSWVDWR